MDGLAVGTMVVGALDADVASMIAAGVDTRAIDVVEGATEEGVAKADVETTAIEVVDDAAEEEAATTAAITAELVVAVLAKDPKLLPAVTTDPAVMATLLIITTSPAELVTLTSTLSVPKPLEFSKKL